MNERDNQEAERAAPELLPCPMCGAAPATSTNARSTYHYVGCDNCFLQIGPYDTPFEAQEKWNHRAPAVGEDGLPAPVAPKGPFADYSAEEVEAYASQYARDAVVADRRALLESTAEMDRAGRDALRACGNDQATARDAALCWSAMMAAATEGAS